MAGRSATPVTIISQSPAHTKNKLVIMMARNGREYKAMPTCCARAVTFMIRVAALESVFFVYKFSCVEASKPVRFTSNEVSTVRDIAVRGQGEFAETPRSTFPNPGCSAGIRCGWLAWSGMSLQPSRAGPTCIPRCGGVGRCRRCRTLRKAASFLSQSVRQLSSALLSTISVW